MFFDQFDRIRVINLPERHDRRRETLRELRKLGISDDPRVSFFDAIRPLDSLDFTSAGARGVYESHTILVSAAAAAGESLLILEDDCAFRPDAAQYYTEEAWDIFYGGYYAADANNLNDSDIIGAHMMGLSSRLCGRMAEYLSSLEYIGVHPPIDAAYVLFRRANPDVRTHFAVPPLATQRSSRSDIAQQRLFDMLPVVRDVAERLRGLKRTATRLVK